MQNMQNACSVSNADITPTQTIRQTQFPFVPVLLYLSSLSLVMIFLLFSPGAVWGQTNATTLSPSAIWNASAYWQHCRIAAWVQSNEADNIPKNLNVKTSNQTISARILLDNRTGQTPIMIDGSHARLFTYAGRSVCGLGNYLTPIEPTIDLKTYYFIAPGNNRELTIAFSSDPQLTNLNQLYALQIYVNHEPCNLLGIVLTEHSNQLQ